MARPIDPRSRRTHRILYAGIAIAIVGGIAWMVSIQAQSLDGTITLDALAKNLGQDPYNIVVIDTRPHDAWVAGHLPFSSNVPLEQLGRRVGEFGQAKDRQVAIIDEDEKRERAAVQMLTQAGFRSVVAAPEGMGGWRDQGRRLETGDTGPIR